MEKKKQIAPLSFYVYVKDPVFNTTRVFKKISTMTSYGSFVYEKNYTEKNVFSIEMQKGNEQAIQLIKDFQTQRILNGTDGIILIVVNDLDPKENGIITGFQDVQTSLVFNGFSLLYFFEKFLAVPKGVVSDSQPKADKIEIIDKVATVAMKEFIDRSFINPDEPRDLPLFTEWFEIVNEPDFGDNISIYGRFDKLYLIIQQELEANQIGINIEFDPFSLKPFKIKFYKGVVRENVELSVKNHTLIDYEYNIDITQTINSAYALGEEQAGERKVARFEKAAPLGAQGEGVTDARDVDVNDTVGLLDQAKAYVLSQERSDLFKATYNQNNEAFILDKDFFLGDVVKISAGFFVSTERINKIITTYSQTDGKIINISIEKDLNVVNSLFKTIDKRIAKVENYTKLDYT